MQAARRRRRGGSAPTPTLDYFAGDFAVQPNAANAIWPSAAYDPVFNKTYYCWLCEGSPQLIRVAAYDHATGVFSQPVSAAKQTQYADDTHGNPAIVVLPSGHIAVFGLCHGGSIQWSVSTNPGDITAWNYQTAITGQNTYPKPMMVGSDLWLGYRVGGSDDAKFVVRKGTVSGATVTFGSEINLIDFTVENYGIYVAEVRARGTDIEWMYVEQHPGTGGGARRNICYAAYDTLTGALRNLSGGVSVASGSLPINLATSQASFAEFAHTTNESDIPSWCRDTTDRLHAAFFDGVTGSPCPLKHMINDGSGWSTPETVLSLEGYGFPQIRYICLAPSGTGVQLWYPDGKTGGWTVLGGDNMYRRVYDGTWGAEELILAGDGVHALAHPSSIHNAHDDAQIVFFSSAQTEDNQDRFRAQRYVWGASGFLKWPVPPQYADMVVEEIVYEGANNSTPLNGPDRSFTLNDTLFVGNAKIFNNRLLLDGTGDYVRIGAATAAFNIRYRMWGARQDNDGEFALDVCKVKLANTTQTCAIYGRAGATTNLSLALFYRGDSGTERFEVELSTDGTTATLLTWTVLPDTSLEYDFRVSRDPSGQIRLHAGPAGGVLTMRASAAFGTGPLFQASTVRPLHGAWSNTLIPMNGSLRGVRVTMDHRGTTDADLPASIMDWAA